MKINKKPTKSQQTINEKSTKNQRTINEKSRKNQRKINRKSTTNQQKNALIRNVILPSVIVLSPAPLR